MQENSSELEKRTTKSRNEEFSSMAKLTHEAMKRLRRYENVIENCPHCKEALKHKDA